MLKPQNMVHKQFKKKLHVCKKYGVLPKQNIEVLAN